MRSDHHRLLAAAGFRDILELDVTPALAASAAAWLAETEPYAEELARLEAPGAFAQRQADRRSMLAAIHAGLLRRALLLARTRGRQPTARGLRDPVATTVAATGSTIAKQRLQRRR
jgi:hypothetical protein